MQQARNFLVVSLVIKPAIVPHPPHITCFVASSEREGQKERITGELPKLFVERLPYIEVATEVAVEATALET